MPLETTFNLTPRAPSYYISSTKRAYIRVLGADFNYSYCPNFETQYTQDRLYFDDDFAADPAIDYSVSNNRRKTRFIHLRYDLSALGDNKELALIFGFQVFSLKPRLHIYTDDSLLSEVNLIQGDNQFLMEVEGLDPLNIYFIHVAAPNSTYGGDWAFTGISGYVV